MKFYNKMLPVTVLGMGILGALLRLWFFFSGTDQWGLYPAKHPATLIMFLLVALAMGLLFPLLRQSENALSYSNLFPPNKLSFFGCLVGSVGILANTLFTASQTVSLLWASSLIFGVLAAAAMVLTGYLRQKKLRPHYLFYTIVTVYFMLQLICRYQNWNTKPQLVTFFPQLMASVFLMLGFFYRACLDADSRKCREFTFYNLGALFFCLLASLHNDGIFFLCMAVWCLTNTCMLPKKEAIPPMILPDAVLYCIATLEDAGHVAYAVGGCVRDHLLGLTPADYDLCTDATPEEICALFAERKLVRNGEKHGTIGVVISDKVYEITTFRTEGSYTDTRHPDWVEFVTDIKEDLARRDFTVNAMAYAPSKGYVDPFGGQADLENRVLRAVGDPETRFREDALRILRGVRFSVKFDLTPEENTLNAMLSCAPLMEQLAKERIFSELCKLLPLISKEDLIRYQPIILQIIPELSPVAEQGNYPKVAQTVEAVARELPVRIAALLSLLDEETGSQILLRVNASNALKDQVLSVLALQKTALSPDKKQLRQLLGEYGAETIDRLLALKKALAETSGEDTTALAQIASQCAAIRSDGSCLTIKDLAITGADILALGVAPGPHIGQCMQSLLSLVQEDILTNTKAELLDAAKTFLFL